MIVLYIYNETYVQKFSFNKLSGNWQQLGINPYVFDIITEKKKQKKNKSRKRNLIFSLAKLYTNVIYFNVILYINTFYIYRKNQESITVNCHKTANKFLYIYICNMHAIYRFTL